MHGTLKLSVIVDMVAMIMNFDLQNFERQRNMFSVMCGDGGHRTLTMEEREEKG